MKNIWIFLLAVSVLFLGGCQFLDSITGVQHNQDGSVTVQPGGGAVGAAGSLASGLPGWLGLAGTLLGTAGTLYQRVRSKQYSQALAAVVSGVDTALDAGRASNVTKEALYAAIVKMISEQSDDPTKTKALISGVKDAFRNG